METAIDTFRRRRGRPRKPQPEGRTAREEKPREALSPPVERFLSVRDVMAALGIGARSTIQLMVKDGRIPRPVHVGTRRIAWPASEIEAVQKKLIAQRDGNLKPPSG